MTDEEYIDYLKKQLEDIKKIQIKRNQYVKSTKVLSTISLIIAAISGAIVLLTLLLKLLQLL